MIDRREWLKLTATAGAALTLSPRLLEAFARGDLVRDEMITRTIPGTIESIPVIGLGSSATFAALAGSDEANVLGEVLSTLVEQGGAVFDTAPGYAGGTSEEVAGQLVQDLGIVDQVFWATKLNVAQDGTADPAAARAQVETSFDRVGKDPIDLIQVHNMGDPAVQLPILREYKEQGRVRYYGITTTFESQYDDLISVMRNEPLDFIGTDYAVDNLFAEETILPLAQERGIGVLVYAPFGRTRLWNRVEGREVPDWAVEFDATTWAQFFLKFVVSHPAVTAATPATSQPHHMLDNLGGGMGRLPDEATRQRMVEYVDALPSA